MSYEGKKKEKKPCVSVRVWYTTGMKDRINTIYNVVITLCLVGAVILFCAAVLLS